MTLIKSLLLFLMLLSGFHSAYAQNRCSEVFQKKHPLRFFIDYAEQRTKAIQSLENKQFEQAIQYGLVALKAQPNDLSMLHVVAAAHRSIREYDKAAWFYERALQFDMAQVPTLEPLLATYRQAQNAEKALATVERIMEVEGETPRTLATKIGVLIEFGRLEQAEVSLDILKALEKDPEAALFIELRLEEAKGDDAMLVEKGMSVIMQKRGERAHDPRIYGLVAKALVRQGEIDQAIEVYRYLLTTDGWNIIGLSQMAHLLILKGQFQEALPLLEKAMVRERNNPILQWNYIVASVGQKRFTRLSKWLDGQKSRDVKNIGRIAILVGERKFSEALESLESVESSLEIFVLLRAQAQYELGRFNEAFESLLSHVLKQKENVPLRSIAALIYIEKGNQTRQNYKASPVLKSLLMALNGSELKQVVEMSESNVWEIENMAVDFTAQSYFNPFYSSTDIKRPFHWQDAWARGRTDERPADKEPFAGN